MRIMVWVRTETTYTYIIQMSTYLEGGRKSTCLVIPAAHDKVNHLLSIQYILVSH